MSLFASAYLAEHSLEDLRQTLHVRALEHTTLPLVVLNYTEQTPKGSPIAIEARGLVLELGSWRCVGKGLSRFFNWGEARAPDKDKFDWTDFTAWSKEDGSFMLLFFYNGEWQVSTRNNFADGPSPGGPSYRELFEGAVGCTVSELGNRLDQTLSYSFELCSPQNHIVRQYPEPRAYLLAAHSPESLAEASDSEVDALAAKSGLVRPDRRCFEDLTSVLAELQERAITEPTFEGYVVKDGGGRRWKVKSPRYLNLHRIRFRGWAQSGPRELVRFILSGELDELFAVLSLYQHNVQEIEAKVAEYSLAVDAAREDVHHEWAQARAAELCERRGGTVCGDRGSRRVFAQLVSKSRWAAVLLGARGSLLEGELDDEARCALKLNEAFNSSEDLLLKLVFNKAQMSEMEQRVGARVIGEGAMRMHSDGYCGLPEFAPDEPNDGLAVPPVFCETTNEWQVTCFCGHRMELHRLRADLVERRTCHCGGELAKRYVLKSTRLVYLCTAPGCLLLHEATQCDQVLGREGGDGEERVMGQPLGIPPSASCKRYRLHVHQYLDQLWTGPPRLMSRGEAYQLLAKLMGLEQKEAHVARFSISQCRQAIQALSDYLEQPLGAVGEGAVAASGQCTT